MKWTIYDRNGKPKHESITEYNGDGKPVFQDTLEYSGKWMGECFITVSVKSPYPIDFQIGDYIEYRGERFTINYDPTVIKKAQRGTYGEGFTYDNIKFNSYSNELTEMMFHDWVLYDNNIHYTSLPNFSFYCKDVDDLADRLQANADRWCRANGKKKEDYWLFYTLKNNTSTGTKDKGQIQTTYERTVQRAKDILYSCGLAETEDEYKSFVSKIKDNWISVYGEGAKYSDSRDDERFDRTITASTQTVWDLMTAVKQQFGLNFVTRGRNVYIGTRGVPTSHLFQYGKGKGLYEIDKTADQDQKVITKLHAYGSDENLPTRYYADLNIAAYLNIKEVTKNELGSFFECITDIQYQSRFFSQIHEKYDDVYVVRLKIDEEYVNARVYKRRDNESAIIYSECFEGATDSDDNTDEEEFTKFQKLLKEGAQVFVTEGAKMDSWPVSHLIATTPNLPDNMAVNFLMLPGFPNYSLADICRCEYDKEKGITNYYITNPATKVEVLFHSEAGEHIVKFSAEKYDPYVVSPNAEMLGVKEGDIFCNEENDDNGLKKVYPTIEEITDIDAGTGNTGVRLDTIVKADTVKDNGVWPHNGGTEVPGFNVWLPNLGFDLRKAATDAGGSEIEISMKNGYCGGRTFKVSQVSQEKDGTWRLSCSRVQDTSLDRWFPYAYSESVKEPSTELADAYQILPGDNYVITGIAVNDVNYVWAASVKLLRKAIHWLCKNDYTRYVYTPKIDEIYMARQNEEAIADKTGVTKSLHDTLKEGDLLMFADEDLGLNGSVYIDNLSIKENGNNGIATYEVTLRNEITVGTIQKIQNAVDSLKTDIESGAIGGGLTPTDIDALTRTYGEKYFISKLTADEAAGRITFDRGIVSKEDVTAGTVIADGAHSKVYGDNAGYRLWLTDGASNLELDNLTVRGKWVAHVLEVMRLQYSEGNRLLGCAGSTIQSVEAYSADDTKIENGDTSTPVSYYRCYFPATDGTDHISQPWHKGDYARCQTFNLTDGTYVDATNRIYMRLVTDVSSSPVKPDGTGNECHWVDLSNERNILLSDDTLSPHVDNKPCMGYLYLTDKESGRITDINDIPASGDHIAQVGNAIDTSRQGAIQLIVNGDNPAICVYGGINRPSQSLDEFLYHKISPAQTIINSQQIVLTTGMHQSYPYVDCGDWTEGTTAYQTEVYRYGGSTWVCLKNDTTSAPNSEDGCWAVFAEKGRDAASKRYILIPNIGSIRRNKFGIASAPKNTVTTKLVYYGGRLIAIDEQHTKMLADRQTPKADDADFRAKGYMFVDNIETKDTSAAVQIEQRDTLGNTLAVVTGADEASLQFADIDAKADSLEVTYLTDGQPCAARTVPIIYDGTDGEDGQDGEEYTVQPSQIIITERLDGTLLDDDAQLKSRLEYIYDLPQTFRIMHNHGGESESVEYDRFARGKGSALLGQTRPERVGDYYRISDGYGISTRELQANTDIRQMEYKMYVDGHVVILPIYINRIGTMVSRTVGDTTETLRKRTYTWADEEGTAHTGTLESFVSDASDIFSRTMKKVVEGQTEAQSNITQTADKISASVTSLKDGISKTGIDIDAHTITAQGEQFRWLNPDGTPLVEFKSNITENAGATFHGHMDATTISTSSGRFTVDEAGNMTAINGNLQSGQIGRIRIDYNGLLSDINGWRMRIGSNGTAYWGWKDESIGFGYTEITNRGKITTTESINALAGIQMNCQFITDTQKDDIVPGTVFVGITDLTQRFDIRIRTIYMNENGHYLSWPIGQQLQIVNTTNNRISVHSDGQAGTGYFYPSAPKPYADNERSFGQWLTIKEYDTAILMWDGHRWWKTAEYIG